jgi:hypothetical protein
MEKQDTINLLKECDAGTKMAVSSIDDVIESVQDEKLYKVLNKSKANHTRLGNEIHEMLNERGLSEKEPSVIASGMSWMKTNVKLGMKKNDNTIADLITDGCNMGVKSLNRYLNQYEAADEVSKDIAKRLINLEAELAVNMREFL